MTQGVPTEEEIRAEFRSRYLYSGNASKCARECGLDERTGRRIAAELEEMPDFAEDVRNLHSRAMQRHITMRLRATEVAAERLEEDLPIPENVGDGATVTIIDKRADYGRLVMEGERNAQNWARFQSERDGEVHNDREVRIVVEPFTKQDGA